MKYLINGRKPEKFFNYFEEISAIPRGSGNETAIAHYICDIAAAHGLVYDIDEVNNVFVKIPATAKYKSAPAILLQGHMDMVCEKNIGTTHDFTSEGLKLKLSDDGKFLYADGTTLGGDDGVAVAVMLAIIDGFVPEHPPLELLFTVSEETGLIGANTFDCRKISARTMINMDTADDTRAIVGCAGGIRSELDMNYLPDKFSGESLTVNISGLAGGHSGECIGMGRANGDKVMGRLLLTLLKKYAFRLVSIDGGTKDNAIVRESVAVIAVEAGKTAEVSVEIEKIAAQIATELCDLDKNFKVTCSPSDPAAYMLSEADTKNIIYFITTVQTDVISMSKAIPSLVEFSRNIGVIRTIPTEKRIEFVISSRSAIEEQIDYSIDTLDALAVLCGFKTRHYSRYPGWNFSKDSAICDKYKRVYTEIRDQEPILDIIHAGLECGLIKSKIPDMDIISIGPNEFDIHSPDEKLDLDSCEVFCKTVEALII